MNRNILTGPAAVRRSDPFRSYLPVSLTAAGRMAGFHIHQKTDGDTDPAKLTEEQFRETVLKGVKDTTDKTSNLVTEHKALKEQAEKAFKDLADVTKTAEEQAKKIVALEKSLLLTSQKMDPNENPRDYLKRAFPDDCKRIGEAIKKGERNFSLVAKAESTATQPAIVPVQFDTAIYSRVVSYGAFKYLDVHPMAAGTENLIVEQAEPVAVFVPENGVIPESGLDLAPVGMTAKTMGLILGISMQLLQDSDIDLGAYVSLKFSRAVAARADYAAYVSNGTSDVAGLNGGFTGLFNAATVVATAAGHTTVAGMTLADIVNVVTALPEAVLEAGNLSWFMNPLLLPQFLNIKDNNGRPIFLNALEAPAYGAIGTIMGIPVRPVSVAPSSNAAGMPIACLGDPASYAVGIRMDYQFDYSDHARYTAFQRVYRGMMRGAFKIKNAANMLVLTTAAQ